MYKNFKITEKEKKQILEMHQNNGYKKPLNEKSVGNSEYMSNFDSKYADELKDVGEKEDRKVMYDIAVKKMNDFVGEGEYEVIIDEYKNEIWVVFNRGGEDSLENIANEVLSDLKDNLKLDFHIGNINDRMFWIKYEYPNTEK